MNLNGKIRLCKELCENPIVLSLLRLPWQKWQDLRLRYQYRWVLLNEAFSLFVGGSLSMFSLGLILFLFVSLPLTYKMRHVCILGYVSPKWLHFTLITSLTVLPAKPVTFWNLRLQHMNYGGYIIQLMTPLFQCYVVRPKWCFLFSISCLVYYPKAMISYLILEVFSF